MRGLSAIFIEGLIVIGAVMSFAAPVAAQQAYPNRVIRLIVSFPPGGSTDVVARLIADKLSKNMDQRVIVDNRPGGSTVVGTLTLAKSPPDGYTIMMITGSSHVLNSLLIPKLPYDTLMDFAAVATVSRSEYLLVVHPSLPVRNLRQFIALAKARPGELNYATSGSGTAVHLGVEMLKDMVGIKMEHVPYRGSGPALVDLLGGQVQVSFIAPLNVMSYVKAGRLRPIALAGEKRLPVLPQVPTFIEEGVPGFTLKNWYGILAPAGTPKPIIDKLSTEIAQALATPDINEKLSSQGMAPMISGPDSLTALIKEEIAKFDKVIKSANIKLDARPQ